EAEPTADGRTAHPKPDRNSTACPVQGCHTRVATDQDHVWRERDQFRRRFANAFSISGAPAILEPYIAAISPTQFLQALQECSDAGKRFRIVRCPRQEQPDAAHPFTLRAAAASGHAAAAPPMSDMNSRRFTPVSPVLRREGNTPGRAGDCCTAGFQCGL